MKKEIWREGSGETVPNGMLVSVHYRGKLAKNMMEFDSSYSRGEPIEFIVGCG
jgi:FKBP-type peptidyl-prolyl cis-trans isomerase